MIVDYPILICFDGMSQSERMALLSSFINIYTIMSDDDDSGDDE